MTTENGTPAPAAEPRRQTIQERAAAAAAAAPAAPASTTAAEPPPAAPAGFRRPNYAARVVSGKVREPLRLLMYGADGVGKAQPLDAMICTPLGFVPMGEVTAGDLVIGSTGEAVRVRAVFERGEREVYRVSFSDGTATECCGDHLWQCTAWLGPKGERREPGVRSLNEIRAAVNEGVRFSTPFSAPVEFEQEATLPLDPYVLGALIGDGCCTGDSVSVHKPERDVLDRVAARLPPQDMATYVDDKAIRIQRAELTSPRLKSATRVALEMMGLYGTESLTKFVPQPYLLASKEARIELLRGLCDTDGHVVHTGRQVEFGTSSPQLRDDFVFLVRSLGGTIRTLERMPSFSYRGERRVGALCYRIFAGFPDDIVPVSSAKHLARWKPRAEVPRYRMIESIESVGVKPTRCISVDAPDGLYVTDDFVVTHNSSFAAKFKRPLFVASEKGTAQLDVHRMSVVDWSDALMLFDWFASDEAAEFDTLVIDTVDWLEPMAVEYVCRRDDGTCFEGSNKRRALIKDGKPYLAGYGFGDGPKVVLEEWRNAIARWERAWSRRGAEIVLLAHAAVLKERNVGGSDYGVINPAVDKKVADLLCQWADIVLYADRRKLTIDAGSERSRAKVVTDGSRVMHTQSYGAHRAKNRHDLPREMPLEYDGFRKAVDQFFGDPTRRRAALRADIAERLEDLGDAALAEKTNAFLAKYEAPGTDPDRHERVLIGMRARLVDIAAERSTGDAPARGGEEATA